MLPRHETIKGFLWNYLMADFYTLFVLLTHLLCLMLSHLLLLTNRNRVVPGTKTTPHRLVPRCMCLLMRAARNGRGLTTPAPSRRRLWGLAGYGFMHPFTSGLTVSSHTLSMSLTPWAGYVFLASLLISARARQSHASPRQQRLVSLPWPGSSYL